MEQSGLPIDISMARYFASGRAGIFQALQLAFQFFEQTDNQYVVIGAVDTFIDPATLAYLDATDRVLAEETLDGFAPGEGAGFLLLARPSIKVANCVKLFRPGISIEPGHRYSDAPNLGKGLNEAVSKAIEYGATKPISRVVSSMNGESFFTKEFGVTMVRHGRFFSADWRHSHPADCAGDLGAASGALGLCLGMQDALSQPDSQVLVYGASDTGLRASVCISV